LMAGEVTYFWAVMKAHGRFLQWVLYRRRESVFPKTKRGQLRGYTCKSVVWAYFVKGKKTFPEIVGTKR
jgi:hypothetical protein